MNYPKWFLLFLLHPSAFLLVVSAEEVTYPPQLPGGKAVATHTSEEFLQPPEGLRRDVKIATAVPTVDFLYYDCQDYPGRTWSVWGDGSAVGNKYYSAIGDHDSPAGNAFVVSGVPVAGRTSATGQAARRGTFRFLITLPPLPPMLSDGARISVLPSWVARVYPCFFRPSLAVPGEEKVSAPAKASIL